MREVPLYNNHNIRVWLVSIHVSHIEWIYLYCESLHNTPNGAFSNQPKLLSSDRLLRKLGGQIHLVKEDTQPNLKMTVQYGVSPPPRIIFYGAIVLFAIIMVAPVVGIYGFRQVLRPAQQQRVINMIPFMEAFLPPRPGIGDTLPTIVPDQSSSVSAEDLLGLSLITPTAVDEAIVFPTITVTPTRRVPTLTPFPSVTPTMPPVTTVAPAIPAPTATEVLSNGIGIPVRGRMFGFRHEQQTWNNCGPASISIALSYYGWQQDQEYARRIMRPDREDKNVRPDEMVNFVNEQSDIRALWRMGGTLDLLRVLIANDFPVIIGTGYMPEGYDWLGHYQTVVGFEGTMFYLYDSFIGTGENGEGYARPATDVDRDWRHFNRRFIVLYPPERESILQGLLGDHADPNTAAQLAFTAAQEEARAAPTDGYAWFNMGTSLVALGRYQEAATAYDRATQHGLPWRMLWYQFGPYQAYFEVGRYTDVLSLVQSNLGNGGQYVEETYYWQGRALEAQGQLADARASYLNALALNSDYEDAQIALDLLQ